MDSQCLSTFLHSADINNNSNELDLAEKYINNFDELKCLKNDKFHL